MSDTLRLDTLTKESFTPFRGDIFRLTAGPAEATLDLQLVDVSGNGLRGHHGREQFSVHFLGPRDPVLAQMIYRLEHARMGVLEIFLVPIGRDDAGVRYEAVFT